MYKKLALCAVLVSCNANKTIIEASTSTGTLSRNVRSLPDISGPLVLTISSKIWNAFNAEEVYLNDTINSTLSTNASGAVGMVKYKVWDAKLDSLSFSTRNLSFRKFRHGGLRIRIRGLKFTARTYLELEVGFWLTSLKFSGKVMVMSENIRVDVAFLWQNFTIASKVHMGSNIRLFFTGSLQSFNLVEPMLRSTIRRNMEEQIKKAVESEVNPYLQQLKKMVNNAGLSYLFKQPIKWTLHDDTLQIVLNSKSLGGPCLAKCWAKTCSKVTLFGLYPNVRRTNVTLFLRRVSNSGSICNTFSLDDITSTLPVDKMVCLSTNVLQLFTIIWALLFRTPKQTVEGLDVTCVAPEFSCIGTTCSFCTDLHIARLPKGSSRRSFLKCIPRVNFVTWALNNFAHFRTLLAGK